ncbi:MAG: hypothetical protein B7X28_05345 [Halothiobacillus sp. 13-55-253]|nr:MAG: hypothetical protein B7X28_05345 [Halothiobacillus sp. 13-55-253]
MHKDWLPQALMGFLHRHEGREHNRATQLYYFHTDAMGTPRLATDAKQQVVWRWNEDAFGAKVSTDQERHGHRDHDWDHGKSHGIQVNLRYPGQYYDSETGLFYNWNRYYDPSTGRYSRSDPKGLSAGNNSFLYVFANPLQWLDPDGLATRSPTYRCVNCGAPHGGLRYPLCPSCFVKSQDPNGGVKPIPVVPSPNGTCNK